MTKTFEIYFSDLTSNAQEELMEMVGISDPKEMNLDMDVIPIASQDFEVDYKNKTCGNCDDWKCRCSDCPELEERDGEWFCGGNNSPCEKIELCDGWENACPLWK